MGAENDNSNNNDTNINNIITDNTTNYMKMATMEELKMALRIRHLNDELLEYLMASIGWLMHYSNKYYIPLPEKDKLYTMLDNISKMYRDMCSNPSSK